MTYLIDDEEHKNVGKVLKSGILERYVNPEDSFVHRFESEFSNYLGTSECLAVSSGTAALICCLRSLNLSSGDEVLMPCHTYIATALAVVAVGCIPIMVNIDSSFTVDIDELAKNITPRTKAIIAVHMHGFPCNMESLMKLAKKRNLLVIEDVAQAAGGTFKEKKLGSIGDIGAFSFNHYKVISCGEGGAVSSNVKAYVEKSKYFHHGGLVFEEHTQQRGYKSNCLGQNYRLPEVSGAILCAQIQKLDIFIKNLRSQRNKILDFLCSNKQIHFKTNQLHDINGDCARYVFLILENEGEAKRIIRSLKSEGYDSMWGVSKGHFAKYWVDILNDADYFTKLGTHIMLKKKVKFSSDAWAKSERLLKKSVGIAINPFWNEEDTDNLINTLENILLRCHDEE